MRLILPRFTVRRLMASVAIAGGLLGLMSYAKTKSYETNRAWYLARASSYAADERATRRKLNYFCEAAARARSKAEAIADWKRDLGKRPVGLRPEFDPDEKIMLDQEQTTIALLRRQVEHFSKMGQKYLHAVAFPWESVTPDPRCPE